jgi:hypothetical protein
MWNMKDVYVAGERYEDIRRTAEQHNALARMQAQVDAQVRKDGSQQLRNKKLWERVRKALR